MISESQVFAVKETATQQVKVSSVKNRFFEIHIAWGFEQECACEPFDGRLGSRNHSVQNAVGILPFRRRLQERNFRKGQKRTVHFWSPNRQRNQLCCFSTNSEYAASRPRKENQNGWHQQPSLDQPRYWSNVFQIKYYLFSDWKMKRTYKWIAVILLNKNQRNIY